jgi:hypothetical protein
MGVIRREQDDAERSTLSANGAKRTAAGLRQASDLRFLGTLSKLENRLAGIPRYEGSNPSLSAITAVQTRFRCLGRGAVTAFFLGSAAVFSNRIRARLAILAAISLRAIAAHHRSSANCEHPNRAADWKTVQRKRALL